MHIFAFKNTIAEKIARNLSQENVYYLESSKESIDMFLEHVLHVNPKKILGLGSYSGIDKEKIRIETICKNTFRNKTIMNNQTTNIDINYFVIPSKELKLANGIGNSYCNLISFLIMNAIHSNNLQAQFTFLHIPKTFDFELAVDKVQEIT